MYAGIFIDADVDLSPRSEVDCRDRFILKSEKSGLLSSVSSSVHGTNSLNPLRHVEAAREREDATAQAQESYTYALGGKESSITRAGILESSKGGQRIKVGGERDVEDDCDCDEDETDRPWEDDEPLDSILEEVSSNSWDPHLQPLLLTPANLGCMPAIDEDTLERPKPMEAPILAAPRKPREQGWLDEEKGSALSRGKGRKGYGFEEDNIGNAHFVMQYMHANNRQLGLGLNSRGGYRASNGRIDSSPIPPPFDRHDPNRDINQSTSRAGRSTEEVEGTDNVVWDASNSLNYEAAGYRAEMNFSGTNSMVACPPSAANSRLDSRYLASPEPESSGYHPKASSRLFHS